MKKTTLAALVAIIVIPASSIAALISNLDDVQNWTGSGSNRAGLVIQWNDSQTPSALAWGYRWNGTATGEDMLKAIAGSWQLADANDPLTIISSGSGSDGRLSLGIFDYGWGSAVSSISFSDSGVNRTRADWASGYWEYFNVGGTFDTPPSGDPNTFLGTTSYPGTLPNSDWISSWSGFSSRILSNESWDGWSFAAGFTSVPIIQPYDSNSYGSSAVPEPSQIATMLLTLAAISTWVLKQHFAKRKLS